MKIKRKLWLLAGLIMMPISIGNTTTYADEIPKDTPCIHEYVDVKVDPNCTEQGYTQHTCSKCGKEYKDNYLEPLGHDFEEIVVEPTCTKQGFTTHYCKTCGYQYSDNYVDPKGHNYTVVVYEPTCTEDGYTIHKCETCKHEYKDNYVPAIGHEYEAVVTEPTCGEGGYTTYTCKNCGHSYKGDETPAKGHNFLERTVKATCVSYGYTEHICECGERYVTDYVKPLGHNYETVIIPATPEKTGYTKHTCLNCGHTYLSDFVTSGDDGYIPAPIEPPQHIHNYVLTTTVDRLNKTITLEFNCLCGENGVDLLTVLFIDKDENITSLNPIDGIVDYKEYNGEYSVSVIDKKGTVLKEFDIGKKEEEKPLEPEIPDIPPIEHKHEYVFNANLDNTTGILTIEYYCSSCKENAVNSLVVIVTDSEGNGKIYESNDLGIIDLSNIEGKYTVSINGIDGNLLEELKGENKIEPEIPENSGDEEKEDEPQKKNNIMGPVLICVAVVLAGGAVTVIVLLNKKNKKSK